MCDRSRHKFRLSQCRTKHALKGLVVRIPRDKVVVLLCKGLGTGTARSVPVIGVDWVTLVSNPLPLTEISVSNIYR